FVYRNIGDPAYWNRVVAGDVRVGAPLRRAERIVALTPEFADFIAAELGVDRTRIAVIPNGVDAAQFPQRTAEQRMLRRRSFGIDDDDVVVAGYLGALSPEKRPALAIEAVAARPGAHLIVAGDGPLRAELTSLAEQIAPGRVQFTGSIDAPVHVLEAIDVLVVPSRTEGMPANVIESAMVGVPFIGTDVGAVRYLAETFGSGTVVPGDQPDEFIDAFATFTPGDLDPQRARSAAMRFDVSVVTDDWAALLAEVGATRTKRS
ncbi:MAG: glycosyltransferase family 4 protein, partial [Actinomycetes bacterium]